MGQMGQLRNQLSFTRDDLNLLKAHVKGGFHGEVGGAEGRVCVRLTQVTERSLGDVFRSLHRHFQLVRKLLFYLEDHTNTFTFSHLAEVQGHSLFTVADKGD